MDTRNVASREFFSRESDPLARISQRMAERFRRGGRLLAFGDGSWATDAQHVAVEFVHPVLVGKRALPALDLSTAYRHWLPAVLRPHDIVMGFGSPSGDLRETLHFAEAAGALTLALPGITGDYACHLPSSDPFIQQELCEVLYHTLWETVHVFFERQPVPHDAGAAAFLYPFLGDADQPSTGVIPEVAASIRAKAACDERLREQLATEQGEALAAASIAVAERVRRGGSILAFGNGGSASDANDFVLDLVASPQGYPAVPAISLSMEPATVTALANDIGTDAIFLRQLIAHARPEDVAVAISTSGGSANIIAGLEAARARGLLTIGLLGYDGGEICRRRLVDHAIVVPSDQIPRVQEIQASTYHVIIDLLHRMSASP